MFSNDIFKLMIFFNNLPVETVEKIIVVFQVISICFAICSLLYVNHISKDVIRK